MRVVLDTNVLISGLFWPRGNPARILAQTRQGRVRSVISPPLLEEFRRVLGEKFGFESERIEEAVEIILEHSDLVAPHLRYQVVHEDPDDDRVLECAVEGRADAVVTGDHHLLKLKVFRGIPILAPRDFLSRLG